MKVRRFTIRRTAAGTPQQSASFIVGHNLFTGERELKKVFGPLTSLEADLLLIASAIFAVDRATRRGEREDICREIEVTIPVVNFARLFPLISLIERVLYHLSNDAWTIKFNQQNGQSEQTVAPTNMSGRTLLFSGGLDSFAAAVEYGKDSTPIYLVSHQTRNNVTNQAQASLSALLAQSGYKLPHVSVFVSSKTAGPGDPLHDEENTQRTRSFLFLVLGAIVARRRCHREIVMLAENGQLAVHLPLTAARVGALSTHTAHPTVLSLMKAFLNQALSADLDVSNPYVHMTKREVVAKVFSTHPGAIPIANSCWRNARLPKRTTHCGECIPCFVRRIAIECCGKDPTAYARDPWIETFSKLQPDDVARRNLSDLAEFARVFQMGKDEELMSVWPDLYSSDINAPEVILMYRRFAQDVKEIFSRYTALQPLLA
jgi:7-cyano-7-deazaguanine synthase in queuosine biosynthesis